MHLHRLNLLRFIIHQLIHQKKKKKRSNWIFSYLRLKTNDHFIRRIMLFYYLKNTYASLLREVISLFLSYQKKPRSLRYQVISDSFNYYVRPVQHKLATVYSGKRLIISFLASSVLKPYCEK